MPTHFQLLKNNKTLILYSDQPHFFHFPVLANSFENEAVRRSFQGHKGGIGGV